MMCSSSNTRAISLCLVVMVACACWVLTSSALAQGRIQIVTTTTDLRSLVEAVGGERVEVISLVPPAMDAEEYQPKPQDLLRLKNARLLVRVGLDYDLWLDRLLAQADNPDLSRGGAGYVDASFGIPVLEVRGTSVGPATATRMVTGTRITGSIPRTPRSSRAQFWKHWRVATLQMWQLTKPIGWPSSLDWRRSCPNGKQSSRR